MDAPHAGAGSKEGPHSRPLTPGDVRSAVFSTTRMRLGYDVEEVDAFLDHVEWTMDQMTAQVELQRARAADAEQNAEIRLNEVRGALENLLFRLGGPGGRGGGPVTVVPTPGRPNAAPPAPAGPPQPDPLAAWGSPLPSGAESARRSAPNYQPTWGQTPMRPAAVLQVGPPPMGPAVDLPPPGVTALESTKVLPAIGQFPAASPVPMPPPGAAVPRPAPAAPDAAESLHSPAAGGASAPPPPPVTPTAAEPPSAATPFPPPTQ
ncbi:MAG: DivIVA domain-containing protein [Candidatus Nanopelagicales bacterium]